MIEESPFIETIYNGFVIKIQTCGVKGSMVFSNIKENIPGTIFESAEVVIEQFYLGCLSNEMLTFLWRGHLNTTRHKERLLAFYKFFNFNSSAIGSSMYFTIFPKLFETENFPMEDSMCDDIEENFSSKGIYIKITQITYQQNKEIDINFTNARNSRIMINHEENLVEVEHFFAMKTMQVFFTKIIGEKIVKHLSQSLDFQQFRKGSRPHLSKKAEQAIANSPTKVIGQFPFPQKDSYDNQNNRANNKPKKKIDLDIDSSVELQIVISIDIPQINIQNELKKSQAIVTTGERICVLVYNTYIQDRFEKYWIQKTAWAFIPNLKTYIAPTNLYKEEKTMWLGFQLDQKTSGKRSLMEIIMLARNNEVVVNVMNPEFYDLAKPMMSIDVNVIYYKTIAARCGYLF